MTSGETLTPEGDCGTGSVQFIAQQSLADNVACELSRALAALQQLAILASRSPPCIAKPVRALPPTAITSTRDVNHFFIGVGNYIGPSDRMSSRILDSSVAK